MELVSSDVGELYQFYANTDFAGLICDICPKPNPNTRIEPEVIYLYCIRISFSIQHNERERGNKVGNGRRYLGSIKTMENQEKLTQMDGRPLVIRKRKPIIGDNQHGTRSKLLHSWSRTFLKNVHRNVSEKCSKILARLWTSMLLERKIDMIDGAKLSVGLGRCEKDGTPIHYPSTYPTPPVIEKHVPSQQQKIHPWHTSKVGIISYKEKVIGSTSMEVPPIVSSEKKVIHLSHKSAWVPETLRKRAVIATVENVSCLINAKTVLMGEVELCDGQEITMDRVACS
ncbi:hypothetical protein QVD17_30714 [Tagetes erecta]|uniref:Uncharacterized protein n=1 Tax=Tagetes erecta TaxID=13708 RepID=A0AAD8NNM9_TARER|nr:hypothetical protein QVD17_30714 [Tagetes erecta]